MCDQISLMTIYEIIEYSLSYIGVRYTSLLQDEGLKNMIALEKIITLQEVNKTIC